MDATYLGNGLMLARTRWDGYVVVPSYNVDVGIGIVRDGIHEPWTTRLVQELLRPGQTYVNVGANFGYYTVLGGRIVGPAGRVVAIEANPHTFAVLMKTIFWGGIIGRVAAYNRAAYIRGGEELEFAFDFQYSGGGHLQYINDGGPSVRSETPFWSAESLPLLLNDDGKWDAPRGLMNSFKVRTLCLDDIMAGQTADLIHCDVEHAEPYVIMGAVDLLRRSPDCKLIFEWSEYAYTHNDATYRKTALDMWQFLAGQGYVVRALRAFQQQDGGIELSEPMSLEAFVTAAHGDYLAVKAGSDPWGPR